MTNQTCLLNFNMLNLFILPTAKYVYVILSLFLVMSELKGIIKSLVRKAS